MDVRRITEETILKFREQYGIAIGANKSLTPDILKTIAVSAGIQIYNLDVPAKLLVPFNTPFVNRVPRASAKGGSATRWRAVTAYAKPSGADPFVAEGAAAGTGTITTVEKVATYKSYGVRDVVNIEAQLAGKNFQDVKALGVLLALNRLKAEEDKQMLYANPGTGSSGYALPLPATPTVTVSGTGLITTTNAPKVFVTALTGAGWWDMGGNILRPTILSAVHGAPSAGGAGGGAATSNQIKAITTPVNGAVGYAWWVQDAASAVFNASTTKLEAITSTPDVLLTAALGGTILGTATNATIDTSAQTNSFTGLAGWIYDHIAAYTTTSFVGGGFNTASSGSNAHINTLVGNATTFLGTALTTNGAGGISEFDTANVAVFNNAQVSPNVIVLSGTDQNRVNKLVTGSGTTYIGRVVIENGPQIVTGNRAQMIINTITGQEQTLLVDPNAVPGTVFGITETLPYLENNVGSVLEMDMLADYFEIDYAMTTTDGPNYPYEVRCFGAFKDYAPFTQWAISGIGG